ncbi:MAG: VanZ family protein [Gemmatimonadota bacterium]|nr:VanZ family protein [Gemmatimonadota bacterium]
MDSQSNAGRDDWPIRILGLSASLRGLSVTGIVILILVLTLSPSGDRSLQPFSLAFALDLHGVADNLLNVGLFVPLGLAIGWKSRRLASAVLCGLLLSTAIELTQTIVPGRDPGLSDIVFNTLGAGLGVLLGRHPRAWLVPSGRTSIVLTISSVIGAAALMIATALARPTVGQGWTILPHSEVVPHQWGPVLNCAWMLALCIPVGFWSRGKLLLVTGAVVAILLRLIPEMTGATATSYMEWVGATGGLLVGAALCLLARSHCREKEAISVS